MEEINYNILVRTGLAADIRKYMGYQSDGSNPYVDGVFVALEVFGERGETVGYVTNYLLRQSSDFMRRGTPNASYGGDAPWTERGKAVDAHDARLKALSDIIDWFLIVVATDYRKAIQPT